MRLARICISATALALGTLVASAGGAEAVTPCAPGRPPGRPPGAPNRPGQPVGRPPQYPPGQCQLRLSASSAAPRASVTAAGDGYTAGSTVSMRVGATSVGTATAGSDGRFTQAFTVPAEATPGQHDVQATGTGAGGAPYEQAATLQVLSGPLQQQGPAALAGTLRSGAGLAAAPQGGRGGIDAGPGALPGVVAGGGVAVLPGVTGGTDGRAGAGGDGGLVPEQAVGGVALTGPVSSGGIDPLLAVGGGLLLAGIGAGTGVAARRRSSPKP